MSFASYCEYLSRLPLSAHTKRSYKSRIGAYLNWLSSSPEAAAALRNQVERDYAIMDYRRHLLQSGAKPATVNASLAALDNFYLFLGVGKTRIRRQDLPVAAPRALEPEELRRVLKAVSYSSPRNRTIALILIHTGLRISELAALSVGDVFVTARKGEITVRCGKGGKHRVIPMNADLREAMCLYLTAPRQPHEALFLSQKGNRISISTVDHVIRQIARDAGVDMSAHTLRHSCLTRLIRSGADVVTVAEIAGHSRLETTRRYSLPSASVKIAAMEKLNYGSTGT